MPITIQTEPEAKKKAVKTKQINFEGNVVEEKKYRCYFCGGDVDEEFAELSRENLGEVVCEACTLKLVRLVFRIGAAKLE